MSELAAFINEDCTCYECQQGAGCSVQQAMMHLRGLRPAHDAEVAARAEETCLLTVGLAMQQPPADDVDGAITSARLALPEIVQQVDEIAARAKGELFNEAVAIVGVEAVEAYRARHDNRPLTLNDLFAIVDERLMHVAMRWQYERDCSIRCGHCANWTPNANWSRAAFNEFYQEWMHTDLSGLGTGSWPCNAKDLHADWAKNHPEPQVKG